MSSSPHSGTSGGSTQWAVGFQTGASANDQPKQPVGDTGVPPWSGGAVNRFTIGLVSISLVLTLPGPSTGGVLPAREAGSRLRAGGAAFGFRFRWDLYKLDFATS